MSRVVTPFLLVLSALLAATPALAASAAPGDTASTVTLFANFDADIVGSEPNLTLPAPPAGDRLTLNETAGTVLVNASIDGLTMAAQLKQGNAAGGVALYGWPATPPEGTEMVTVGWRAVAQDDNPITFVACVLRGSNGNVIASVEYQPHNVLTWNALVGPGTTLPVTYRQNRNDQFVLTANLLAKTVSLSIDGVAIAGFQNVPFAQDASDVARLGFEEGGTSPQTFAVDDLFAVAFSRAVDHAPTVSAPASAAGSEGALLSFGVSASDPDGDAISSLTAAGTAITAGGAFSAALDNTSGTFSWTPGFAQAGSYGVTFTALNALSGSATTAVTIGNSDRAPEVTAPPSVAAEEKGHATFTVAASDPDGDALTALTADLSSLPLGSTATFTADAGFASGTFDWIPPLGTAGVYDLFFNATAGGLTGTGKTTLFVAAFGTAVTGRFVWTPQVGDEGNWVVTFVATNALNESTSLPVTLTVFPATSTLSAPRLATAPTERSPGAALAPGAIQKGPIVFATGTTSTSSGSTLTMTSTATSSDGSALAGRFSLRRAGATTTAAASASGITLTADLTGLPVVNDAEFIVDQDPVVNAPATWSGDAGAALTVNVGAIDPDGDPIESFTADWSALPAGNDGAFTTNADRSLGSFTWTPTLADSGDWVVTFEARNRLVGDGATTIHVRGVAATRVFVQGNKKINLNSGKAAECVQIEPINASFDLTELDLSTVVMVSQGTGAVSQISAISGKEAVLGDRDGNQIPDLTVCFMKSDLRSLFSLLRGQNVVTVAIAGRLVTGGQIYGTVALGVNAGGGKLAASLYPNPLNPRATLHFTTTRDGFVRVRIYDVHGRMMREVLDRPDLPAGTHEVAIDGGDAAGRPLASGVYFYRIDAREGTTLGRMAIVK
ncbi:MAG TPA: T9SS type A sorting domain-containing protein [Candidatus Eisenbacteria bacterium]